MAEMDRIVTETITVKFERHVSPHEWRAEAVEVPGVVGIGSTMAAALGSWIESLPVTLMADRSRLEAATKKLEEGKRR